MALLVYPTGIAGSCDGGLLAEGELPTIGQKRKTALETKRICGIFRGRRAFWE